ncbi:hypothetical protein CRN15_08040 [Raoultella planticola]|nr:hypothetical protein CRT62_26815 [Raoultella planticola]ATM14812.1 hypothetical protein CRN15_08040 [Raoultella planticola]PHH25245.1 hypothetical protein CRX55_14915 [Raoultella planticola]PIM84399.1 hypothetical protein CT151_12905 [Raoultella planticola]
MDGERNFVEKILFIYTVFVYTENVHIVSFGAACITGAIKSWLKRVVPSAP